MKIVLVEDEKDLIDILTIYLNKEGFEVVSCPNLTTSYTHLHDKADLWVIDLMLGDGNGLELVKDLKVLNINTPIIIMSAKCDSNDRLLGFDLGCDDYLSKPFVPQELLYRINKILKRKDTSEIVDYGFIVIDYGKRNVIQDNRYINLTSKEYDLLCYFIKHSGQALSREQILENAWDDKYLNNDRSVDNFIKKLRKKIPGLNIETIYGYGYRCNV